MTRGPQVDARPGGPGSPGPGRGGRPPDPRRPGRGGSRPVPGGGPDLRVVGERRPGGGAGPGPGAGEVPVDAGPGTRRHPGGGPAGLRRRHGHLVQAARAYFGSWAGAVAAAGVDPAAFRRAVPWTRERVVEAVLRRALGDEPLAARAVRPRSLAAAGAKFFGSWDEAVAAAGLDPARYAGGAPRPGRFGRATSPALREAAATVRSRAGGTGRFGLDLPGYGGGMPGRTAGSRGPGRLPVRDARRGRVPWDGVTGRCRTRPSPGPRGGAYKPSSRQRRARAGVVGRHLPGRGGPGVCGRPRRAAAQADPGDRARPFPGGDRAGRGRRGGPGRSCMRPGSGTGLGWERRTWPTRPTWQRSRPSGGRRPAGTDRNPGPGGPPDASPVRPAPSRCGSPSGPAHSHSPASNS